MTQTDSSTLTLKTKSSSSVATFIHLSTTGKPLRNSTRPPTKLKTIATVVYCSSMPATHNGASTARCWVVTPKMFGKVGKDGRKRRGTRKSSSLSTYWKVFRLVFERATGDKLDPKLNRRMHKVLRDLSRKHDLSDQRRANRCMTIEDLKEQIETTISTTKNRSGLGNFESLLFSFSFFLHPLELAPHPSCVSAFTKTYLGVKDAKTFPLPETLADPSLLLNPHIFLLGILFRHRAFRATSLNSPAQLANLDIHPEERELPLPLKDDLKDTYIFRRAMKTFTGYELSQDKPLSYQMIAQWIRRVGEILGLEYPTIPYNLRYNAANEFDRSASADISESLRNLALDHANSNPFQKHYLGRESKTFGIIAQVQRSTWNSAVD
ncbi:C2H2 finger domain-containing protein [Hirsutella rhossiliensis]|uniref:C2H2 finger domain-containing protein n=2 Tax=Hirsutella rhossiliensis TaxID=111463 RepID=A0A9P8MTL5_9HYPO|nr:C2H2 finger domain-containing protein [Hirsutella rhossiliensis]KAH0961187.1 C2H2 finger domain-containing protein [Hirsutella rhossiliensis]